MDTPRIAVRFFRLSEKLHPYFTALYLTRIEAGDGVVEDYLHPEWAGVRFTEGPPPLACIGPGEMVPQSTLIGVGPTSRATHFAVRTCQIWGLGMQPAGWARFAGGWADDLANRIVDGSAHPSFAAFAGVLPQILACEDGDEAKAQLIDAHLLAHAGAADPREPAIFACQEALRDPALGEVGALQERLGMPVKSLERFCRRYFGFPPKLLLRRQRFARSLARFMLDPTMSWIDALDGQYHDQAQFVREFREFMGMLPSEYARKQHPIVQPIMRQRLEGRQEREPLDLPTVARFR